MRSETEGGRRVTAAEVVEALEVRNARSRGSLEQLLDNLQRLSRLDHLKEELAYVLSYMEGSMSDIDREYNELKAVYVRQQEVENVNH